MDELIDFWKCFFHWHHHRHPRHARRLRFSFALDSTSKLTGDFMNVTMLPTDTKRSTVSPVKADGTPSTAKLSLISFTSSDPLLATVAPDSANPATVVITGLGKTGSVIVTANATGTEPDGATESLTGALTVSLAVPPPAPAAALVFSPLV
jgi:hypothetical protein